MVGLSKGNKTPKRKKTPETLDKIRNALQMGLGRDEASVQAGISRHEFYNWYNDDPNFKRLVEDAEERWMGAVEKAKYNKIIKEEYRPAIEKELKSKKRAIYGDKQEVDHKVDMNLNLKELSEDELTKIIKEQ